MNKKTIKYAKNGSFDAKIGTFISARLLSDNDPTVPARSGEMSDSHIGPSGPCAGLRKMILRRK